MRFDKKNPIVWMYFLTTAFNIVIGSVIIKLFPKKSKKIRIVLFGHKLDGNIRAFLDYIKRNKIKNVEISYITIDYKYYKELRKTEPNVKILCSEKLTDIIWLLNSSVIISTHGPSIFLLIKKLQMQYPKFVDVFHSVPYKGLILKDFKNHQFCDKIFASSGYIKKFYINKWGLKEKQVIPVGYAKVDYYFNNTLNRRALLKKYYINKDYKKIILIAPTWKQDNKNRKIFPFVKTPEEFLNVLENIGMTKKVLFIFRTHINSKYVPKKQYSHIKFYSQEEFPLTYELLYISDILISDWTSTSFEFLTLNRPMIFLNVPAPYKWGFTLGPEDRVGYIVNNIKELNKTIINCINHPEEFSKKFKKQRKIVLKKAYDNFLDGKSAERYFDEIKKLLSTSYSYTKNKHAKLGIR